MERIVVGVDGSSGAATALRWAVREGAIHEVPVLAVMAWGFLDQHHAAPSAEFDPHYNAAGAMEALDDAVAEALGDDAGLVQRQVVCDLAAPALLSVAGPLDLLVVGARGHGGFAGLLLGSVSQRCLHDAHGPVAVIRSDAERTTSNEIVVGVDGSPVAQRALEWAVAEGRAREAPVRVVHGWTMPFVGGQPFGMTTLDPKLFEEPATLLLARAIDAVDTSGVDVRLDLRYGTPAQSVLEAASGAALVVVGSHGIGGLRRVLLGSASQQIVHHAASPVVVIPAT